MPMNSPRQLSTKDPALMLTLSFEQSVLVLHDHLFDDIELNSHIFEHLIACLKNPAWAAYASGQGA